jgi:hypothetical protein
LLHHQLACPCNRQKSPCWHPESCCNFDWCRLWHCSNAISAISAPYSGSQPFHTFFAVLLTYTGTCFWQSYYSCLRT